MSMPLLLPSERLLSFYVFRGLHSNAEYHFVWDEHQAGTSRALVRQTSGRHFRSAIFGKGPWISSFLTKTNTSSSITHPEIIQTRQNDAPQTTPPSLARTLPPSNPRCAPVPIRAPLYRGPRTAYRVPLAFFEASASAWMAPFVPAMEPSKWFARAAPWSLRTDFAQFPHLLRHADAIERVKAAAARKRELLSCAGVYLCGRCYWLLCYKFNMIM